MLILIFGWKLTFNAEAEGQLIEEYTSPKMNKKEINKFKMFIKYLNKVLV